MLREVLVPQSPSNTSVMQVQVTKCSHHSILGVILITTFLRNISVFHWCKYNQALRTRKQKEDRDTLVKQH